MSGTTGRTLRLSAPRRIICDFLRASRGIPLIPFERTMELSDVAVARQAWPVHPTWYALFLRAFGLVAAQRAELRRVYVPYPWPRLYEHPGSIAGFAVERQWGEEPGVFLGRVKHPERKSLADIDAVVRACKELPLEQLRVYRRAYRVARWPLPLRRLAWGLLNWSGRQRVRTIGTFGISATAGLGASALTLVSPVTTTLNYDCLQADGRMRVRLIFDHRVYDGGTAARALADMEEALHGQILDELRNQDRQAA